MKEIYFATNNKGKVNYLRGILSEYDIEIIQISLNIPEPRSNDVQEIAKAKALFAYEHIKKPCIVTDSGLYIHSLNGFPRTFVNFVLETIGIEGILKLVEGKPRNFESRDCLAYLDKSLSEPVCFKSTLKGTLSYELKGEKKDYHWSRLCLILMPNNKDKTLAEMDFEEHNKWRKERDEDSFIRKFAEWVLSR